jgi:hypothetical protein
VCKSDAAILVDEKKSDAAILVDTQGPQLRERAAAGEPALLPIRRAAEGEEGARAHHRPDTPRGLHMHTYLYSYLYIYLQSYIYIYMYPCIMYMCIYIRR